MWNEKKTKQDPDRLSSALIILVDKECFVNIFAVLQVYETIPISSLNCERSISTLRNLKNYLRNTVSHGRLRLNGLALMDTHAEIELDLNELIDLFQPTPLKNDGKYLGRLDTLLWQQIH